jgi:hypothetical protein
MICKTSGDVLIWHFKSFKLNKKIKKVMRFENKKGQN